MKQHLQIALDHEPLAWINGVVYSNRPAWYNVTARALHMDLIVPKERPHHAPQPAVLFLCGGAYMVMDRSIWLPELMTLARAGYTVASMEYRTNRQIALPTTLPASSGLPSPIFWPRRTVTPVVSPTRSDVTSCIA